MQVQTSTQNWTLGIIKRLYGYLAKSKHYVIRYRTKEADYSPYLNRNMNSLELFMEMSKKKS